MKKLLFLILKFLTFVLLYLGSFALVEFLSEFLLDRNITENSLVKYAIIAIVCFVFFIFLDKKTDEFLSKLINKIFK